MGTSKWCCSGFREPESKVYADPDAPSATDVRQFVEESSLHVEVGDEMEPVADTFRGVENLNGVFNWEVQLHGNSKQRSHIAKNYEKDQTIRDRLMLKEAESEWVEQSSLEPRKRLLSLFSKILPQKTCNKNAVELTEFARDSGNEDCTLQPLPL